LGNALTLSTTITECPSFCDDSNDAAATTTSTPFSTSTPSPTFDTVCDGSITSNTGTYTNNGQTFNLQCNTEPGSDAPMANLQVKTFGECLNACATDVAGGCIGVVWSQLAADIHNGYPYCALVNSMSGPYQPYTGIHVALLGSTSSSTTSTPTPTPTPSTFPTICDSSTTSNTGSYSNNGQSFSVKCNTVGSDFTPMTLVSVKTFGECMNACAADISGGCIGVFWSQVAADIHNGYPYCALASKIDGPYSAYANQNVALLVTTTTSTPTPTPTPSSKSTVCDTSSTSNTGTYSSNGYSFGLQCNTEPGADRPMTLVQAKTFGECIDACAADIAGGCIGVYWSQLAADIHNGYPYCAMVSYIVGPYQPMTGQHVALLQTTPTPTPTPMSQWNTICDGSTTANQGSYVTSGKNFFLECNTEPTEYRPMTISMVNTFGQCINSCATTSGCIGVFWDAEPAAYEFGYPYCGLLSQVASSTQPNANTHLALLTTPA
jgi:hypothetical protein